MFVLRNSRAPGFIVALALLVAGCGAPSQSESGISTAVAQTVVARDSLTEVARVPTNTPAAGAQATPSPAITLTAAPTLVSAPADPNCVGASLVAENPPDGTIVQPGEYFWKTWTIRNTGTCAWSTAYQLVYKSGDLMGGLISYPLPDDVLPGEQKDISIYLQAPPSEGTFTGYWQLKSPWEASFGVGPYSQPMYVQVVVSNKPKREYGVTAVTYEIKRDPPVGCPLNVRYTVYATISASGPIDIAYRWDQSDGNESGIRPLEFTEASSITLSREWLVSRNDSPNPRWMRIIVIEPQYQEYAYAHILKECPADP